MASRDCYRSLSYTNLAGERTVGIQFPNVPWSYQDGTTMPPDVVLHCGEDGHDMVHAHKIVLVSISHFFEILFLQEEQEHQKVDVVCIPDVSSVTMRHLLRLAYVGSVDIPARIHCEVMEAMIYLQWKPVQGKLDILPYDLVDLDDDGNELYIASHPDYFRNRKSVIVGLSMSQKQCETAIATQFGAGAESSNVTVMAESVQTQGVTRQNLNREPEPIPSSSRGVADTRQFNPEATSIFVENVASLRQSSVIDQFVDQAESMPIYPPLPNPEVATASTSSSVNPRDSGHTSTDIDKQGLESFGKERETLQEHLKSIDRHRLELTQVTALLQQEGSGVQQQDEATSAHKLLLLKKVEDYDLILSDTAAQVHELHESLLQHHYKISQKEAEAVKKVMPLEKVNGVIVKLFESVSNFAEEVRAFVQSRSSPTAAASTSETSAHHSPPGEAVPSPGQEIEIDGTTGRESSSEERRTQEEPNDTPPRLTPMRNLTSADESEQGQRRSLSPSITGTPPKRLRTRGGSASRGRGRGRGTPRQETPQRRRARAPRGASRDPPNYAQLATVGRQITSRGRRK